MLVTLIAISLAFVCRDMRLLLASALIFLFLCEFAFLQTPLCASFLAADRRSDGIVLLCHFPSPSSGLLKAQTSNGYLRVNPCAVR